MNKSGEFELNKNRFTKIKALTLPQPFWPTPPFNPTVPPSPFKSILSFSLMFSEKNIHVILEESDPCLWDKMGNNLESKELCLTSK